MRYLAIVLLLIVLSVTNCLAEDENVAAPTVLSIIPGQAAPGSVVVISGSGFTSESTLFLGIDEVPLKTSSARQLSFELPQIPAGNYALYVRQKSGASSRAYSFTVIPVKPAISSISPDSASLCSADADRQVTVRGKNFLDGARILFDGAIIRGSRTSAEEMTFQIPAVPGGIHQVQVKNPEDAASTAIALVITSRPEIRSVTQGDDYVNYYELHIDGINFQQGSALVVNGKKIHGGYPVPGERDRVIYLGCNRLTYQRYPYDPSIKSFQMLVVNPNGEESGSFTVSAP